MRKRRTVSTKEKRNIREDYTNGIGWGKLKEKYNRSNSTIAYALDGLPKHKGGNTKLGKVALVNKALGMANRKDKTFSYGSAIRDAIKDFRNGLMATGVDLKELSIDENGKKITIKYTKTETVYI